MHSLRWLGISFIEMEEHQIGSSNRNNTVDLQPNCEGRRTPGTTSDGSTGAISTTGRFIDCHFAVYTSLWLPREMYQFPVAENDEASIEAKAC